MLRILVSVYRILTKFGTKMYPDTTFLYTNFQGNQITRFRFMVTFIPRQKEKKMKKLSHFLKAYILETPGVI